MTSKHHSGCSEWAQQGSNLRPLGEQHPYDQGRNNPTDLAGQGSAFDRVRPVSTAKVDAKWTAGLGRRVIQVLVFLAVATLLPALGITIGTVGAEVAKRAAAESKADAYPVGDPTRCHVRALNAVASRLPGLGIEWRWAELDSRRSVGTALLESRIVLLDPELDCADVSSVAYHEWTHIAQADYYGGTAMLDTTVTSDLVDDTGRPHEVEVHEVVADCAAMLLADEHGDEQGPRPYMQMLGGCPADMLARAREVISHAGGTLTASTATPLGEVGSEVTR